MIIAIEGGDQAGKKTQAAMLQRTLRKNGMTAATLSFPDYSTPIGRQIREYLGGRRRLPPQAIHCLLSANRWERLPQIQRAQEDNEVVVMNRYYHSNLVYGMVNGMGQKWLENLDAGLPRADLVILLDVTHAGSLDRKRSGRDRFERDGAFFKRITATYRKVAKQKRWRVVDASRTRREVHDDVMRIVGRRVGLA